MRRVNILGVEISAVNKETAIQYLLENMDKARGKYICACNVHTTVTAHENLDYQAVQNNSFMTLPDGKPLSSVGVRRGYSEMGRVTGPDFMEQVIAATEKSDARHYFYGTTQKNLNAGIRILIISSILYYLIWTVLALDKAPAQSVFFESISTSVILLPVAALLGFDDNIWNILENKLPYINILFCCCFYIAVFSFWANYGIKWPMNASYKGIFSCWFTSACIMTFLDFPQKDKRKLIYCNLLLIIAAAFITQSRAWVLQTLILLFIFVAVLGDRNRSVKILMGFLLIIITVLGVSYIFPEITGNLFNRGMEDTRSGQYVIFFAQHSWEDLIFGLGINASYSYLGNKNYTYFDNQFMFVMFHYGIFPVIAWLCAYASTLKGSKIYNEQSRIVIRAAKFVGFFVLLAYMGVSTYYQIELGYSGVIVMMLVGKALREKYYGRS